MEYRLPRLYQREQGFAAEVPIVAAVVVEGEANSVVAVALAAGAEPPVAAVAEEPPEAAVRKIAVAAEDELVVVAAEADRRRHSLLSIREAEYCHRLLLI